MHFWPGEHVALVTEIAKFAKYKSLHIYAGAGEYGKALWEIYRMEESVSDYARKNGCSKLTMFLPPEGIKAAERAGFKHRYSEMCKDIC